MEELELGGRTADCLLDHLHRGGALHLEAIRLAAERIRALPELARFTSLSGRLQVLASDQDLNLLVLDTEVYSNTGGQASTASYTGQNTKMSVHGKEIAGKTMDTYHRWMQVMIPVTMSGCPALTVPVHYDDYGVFRSPLAPDLPAAAPPRSPM